MNKIPRVNEMKEKIFVKPNPLLVLTFLISSQTSEFFVPGSMNLLMFFLYELIRCFIPLSGNFSANANKILQDYFENVIVQLKLEEDVCGGEWTMLKQ